MKFRIGIFTAARSHGTIEDIGSAVAGRCEIEYLPYTTMRQLANVYRENVRRFDGIIFNGLFAYEYVANFVEPVTKHCGYFEIADRDYYKALVKAMHRFPGLDIARVIIDPPSHEVDFEGVFGDKRPQFFDSFAGTAENVGSAYANALKRALALWREGKIDVVITRFSNLREPLMSAGIPFETLSPSAASMRETFCSLITRLQSAALDDALAVTGIVTPPAPKDDRTWKRLESSINDFNSDIGMGLVINRRPDSFELTTTNDVLKEITLTYTACPLTEKLKDETGSGTSLGWGIGRSVLESRKNARKAAAESTQNPNRYSYIVNDDDDLVGPLGSGQTVTMKASPHESARKLASELGISAKNMQKILNLLEQKAITRLSSSELAFYLNITQRSANRILVKLVDMKAAAPVTSSQSKSRGRPSLIYEIDCTALD